VVLLKGKGAGHDHMGQQQVNWDVTCPGSPWCFSMFSPHSGSEIALPEGAGIPAKSGSFILVPAIKAALPDILLPRPAWLQGQITQGGV
jgi:hypothetical protein